MVADVIVAEEVVVCPSDTDRVEVSHSSMPPMVHNGMFVNDDARTEFVIEPPDGVPQTFEVVVSWREYVEPPVLVTSLPIAVAVDGVAVVISARLTGLTTAGYEFPATLAPRIAFASTVTMFATVSYLPRCMRSWIPC